MTKQIQPSIRVVLKLPRRVADVLVFGQKVHDQMAAHAIALPSPDPALPKLQSDLDDLSTKEALAKTRASGAVAARDVARRLVARDLRDERTYVEKVCNASPDNALSIAEDAGMTLRKAPTTHKLDLAAKHVISGTLHVTAKATKGARANGWQVSTDGGKTWLDLPTTTKANTLVPNLTVATTVSFRHRALTKVGWADWGNPISTVVS